MTIEKANTISNAMNASSDEVLKTTALTYLKIKIHTMPNPEALITEETDAGVINLVNKELKRRATYQAALTALSREDD